MVPAFWLPDRPDAVAWFDAPRRERTATALPPGVPLQSLSINRPGQSGRLAGGRPLIGSGTGWDILNGLIGGERRGVDGPVGRRTGSGGAGRGR